MSDHNDSNDHQEYKNYDCKVKGTNGCFKENKEEITITQSKNTILDNDEELVRTIPFDKLLIATLYSIIQTQDIFTIRFQPQFSECDINIYEFKKYVDIRGQVVKRLKELRFNEQVKQNIIDNLDKNSQLIQHNIEYFGVAHIFD